MHPHVRIHRDDEGPDVQGCTFARGDPGLVDLYQLFDRFHAERFVNERDAEPVVGEVEPRHVFLRAEEYDLALRSAVGFHPLENLLAVVQAHGGRIESQGAVGDDPGIVPTLAFVVIHQKHMVGEDGAEAQGIGRGGLRLGRFGRFHADFLHGATLPIIGF